MHLKRSICVLLCLVMGLSMSSCSSGSKITEENVTKTVELVEKALREFDTESLKKYLDTPTLSYIINLANSHEQINEIGKLMFENVTLEIKSIDVENETVTLLVNNKDLSLVGERYAKRLNAQFKKLTDLLAGFSDETFLDSSYKQLSAQISRAIIPDNPTEVTVTVKSSGNHLELVFDQAAEDAVSGGAVTAITTTYKGISGKEENSLDNN